MPRLVTALITVLAIPFVSWLVAGVLVHDPSPTVRDVSNGALLTGALGLALVAFIWLLGLVGRRNRMLLLVLFHLGLFVTAFAVVLLVLCHAALAIATIGYVELMLIDRLHVVLLLAIGFGALVAAISVFNGVFTMFRKARLDVTGMPVRRDDAPKLWAEVERLARELGALPPEHIVLGLDPNFFVTEAIVVVRGRRLRGRTLYCSLLLARILSGDEFRAIVGHELGHFRGADTRFSERFYPIYRGASASLEALANNVGDGPRGLAVFPAVILFSYFLGEFTEAESTLGREREIEADRVGASLTSQRVMASALVKVHAFAGATEAVGDALIEQVQQGRMIPNLAAAFAKTVAGGASPAVLDGIESTHTEHPTDSHPPLHVRLAALGVDLADVRSDALDVRPSVGATDVIDDHERFERELSERIQAEIARTLAP